MQPTPGKSVSRHVPRWVAFLAVVLLAVSVHGCGRTESSHADYPGYSDLKSLFTSATLVVEAKVGPGKVQELVISQETGEKAVYTVYDVTVEHTYKGENDPVVPVKQAGGKLGRVSYVEDDAVALEPGTTVILFLETYVDSPASLLNPTQGQYRVDEAGGVTSLEGNPIRFSKPDLQRLSAGA